MDNTTNINKIKNNYILKSLFSYISYQTILKLIKNNKKLQKRLGIGKDKYKLQFSPIYEYAKEKKFIRLQRYSVNKEVFFDIKRLMILIIVACSLSKCIYIIILIFAGTFNNANTKANYNKSSLSVIERIDRILYIFYVSIFVFVIINRYYYNNEIDYDYGIKKIFKFVFILLYILINILFEGLVIWKLILSYEIIKGATKWFMVFDYIFLSLNLIYIIIIILFLIGYLYFAGGLVHETIHYILLSYNNIKIKEYVLPEYFEKMNLKERKKIILDNLKNYEYIISDKQKELIDLINNLRVENDIQKLETDKNKNIPNFIFKKPSALMLTTENIFKISNTKYIFKYPVNEFENKVRNKDYEIINIILNDNLNHIQIVTQKETEYIFIFKKERNDISENVTSYNKIENKELFLYSERKVFSE